MGRKRVLKAKQTLCRMDWMHHGDMRARVHTTVIDCVEVLDVVSAVLRISGLVGVRLLIAICKCGEWWNEHRITWTTRDRKSVELTSNYRATQSQQEFITDEQ